MRIAMSCVCWLIAGVLVSPDAPAHSCTRSSTTVVERFLSSQGEPLVSYRALRRLTAASRGGRMQASLAAWTSFDPEHGFQYDVVEETGSGTIRSRVLRPALAAERDARASGDASKGALTELNYEFGTPDTGDDLLVTVAIRPRRKDTLLVDGFDRADARRRRPGAARGHAGQAAVVLDAARRRRPAVRARRGSSGPDVDGLYCRCADCRPVHVLDGVPRTESVQRPDCGCESAPGGLDGSGPLNLPTGRAVSTRPSRAGCHPVVAGFDSPGPRRRPSQQATSSTLGAPVGAPVVHREQGERALSQEVA